MRNHKQWLKVLLLLLLTAATIFAVEGLCNWPLLRAPEAQRGEVSLPMGEVSLSRESGEELPTDMEAEGITLADGGMRADISWSGYVDQLCLRGSVLSPTAYTVVCTLPDGSQRTLRSVFTGLTDIDQLVIHQEVTHLTLRAAQGGLTLTGLTIDNVPHLNPVRMLLSGLTALTLGLLWLLRRLIARRAEIGFLLVALCCGAFLSLGMPAATGLSFDDQIHFASAWDLSFGRYPSSSGASEDLANLSLSTQVGEAFVYAQDTATDYAQYLQSLDAPQNAVLTAAQASRPWELTDTGYLPHALGFVLGRGMGLPMHVQVMLARFMGMLAYVLLCFAALRVLKRFKLTFAALALMPTPMFMAANFSYDPVCTGLCFLGTALMVDAMLDRNAPLRWPRLLVIFASIFLGCTVKAVYAPLLLLMLLMPATKFSSRREEVYVKAISMAVMLVCISGILLDISGDIGTIQDSRAEAADSAGQMAYLLSHPLTYFGDFLSTLLRNFQTYFLNGCRTTWAYLGNCSATISSVSLMLLLFTCFTDNDPSLGQRLSVPQRVGTLLAGGIATGMVFTAMYIGFSAVGSNDFSGVQARYLQPILPLFFLILSPEGIHNRMNRQRWHLVFFLLNLLVLMVTCWQLVLTRLML